MYEDVDIERDKILNNKSLSNRERSGGRPVVITVLIILIASHFLYNILSIDSYLENEFTKWELSGFKILIFCNILTLIGIWFRKKISFFIFLIISSLHYGIILSYFKGVSFPLIFFILLVIFGFKSLKTMT